MRSLFAACLLLAHVPLQAAEPSKPNIIVVMADDIGLGDLGFYHRRRTEEEPVALFDLDHNLAESDEIDFVAHPKQAEWVRQMHTRDKEHRKAGAPTVVGHAAVKPSASS